MKKALIFSLLFFVHFVAASQKTVPELWGLQVHDEAHILSQGAIDNIESQLKAFEDSTSNQIAILIISSLEGEVLEEYSLRVAEKWKLGDREKDNGVLLLIAVDDHEMRIETGQGLEGSLPDVICNRIIRNEIAPNFRKGNYDAGVQAGIDGVIKAIGGEYKSNRSGEGLDSIEATHLTSSEKILVGVFIFGILSVFTFIGLFTPGFGGWFLYVFLFFFYAIFPAVVLGVKGSLIVLSLYAIFFPVLKIIFGRTSWGKNLGKRFKSNSSGRGWTSGSGRIGGGGGTWSSGGGGGFSGGGGSFGGGGSSGSW